MPVTDSTSRRLFVLGRGMFPLDPHVDFGLPDAVANIHLQQVNGRGLGIVVAAELAADQHPLRTGAELGDLLAGLVFGAVKRMRSGRMPEVASVITPQ